MNFLTESQFVFIQFINFDYSGITTQQETLIAHNPTYTQTKIQNKTNSHRNDEFNKLNIIEAYGSMTIFNIVVSGR